MRKFELALQVGLVPRSSDTGKDITLRNANEHKKLEGQLKELDLQLRSKLVNMQAEIMELKASPYGQMKPKKRSPRMIERRERSSSDGRLPLTRENRTNLHGNIPLSRHGCLPQYNGQRDDQSLVLPEINPQKTSLVSNITKGNIPYNLSPAEAGKRRNKAFMSPVDKVFLHVPSPPSLYRPSSLPDLSRLAVNGGSISTRSRGVKFVIPEVKVEQNKANFTKDENQNQLMLQESKNKLGDRINDFVTKKNEFRSETTSAATPVIEVSDADKDQENGTNESLESTDVFYNSMLAKISMDPEDEEESKPDLASFGFMDFNEVIDKRLKQTQEKLPSEEEMRKIRYLRWRVEAPQTDLVETVFDNHEDLDYVDDADEPSKSIT